MKSLNDTKILIQKLANLARCPSAARGEAINAAEKLVKIARKNRIDFSPYSDLLRMISTAESKMPMSPPPISKQWNSGPSVPEHRASKSPDSTSLFTTPPYADRGDSKQRQSKSKQSKPRTLLNVMPSGQYRGKTFQEIFQFDPDYLIWFLMAHPRRNHLEASILEFLKVNQA